MPPDKITPPELYQDRREIMRAAAVVGSVGLTAWLYRRLNPVGKIPVDTPMIPGVIPVGDSPESVAEGLTLAEPLSSLENVGNYNNFYEFTTDKEMVSAKASRFVAKPWQVEVGGLVRKPRTLDIGDIMRAFPMQERIYRMRCVEAWSMVIPWVGFSLSKLLDKVEPTSDAKYVAFETLLAPERMPGQNRDVIPWPYVEGLRLDEAMHPLTILAVGLYGREMPAQNGAPIRLIVPWKYGFKGIKSIVRISLVSTRPPTTWNLAAPTDYGFYANVNPEVPHPRWSQATEQRIGEPGRRATLMFNGYGDQVAHLYAGVDLRENF